MVRNAPEGLDMQCRRGDGLGMVQVLGCGFPRDSTGAWRGTHQHPHMVHEAPLSTGSLEIGVRLLCRRFKNSALEMLMPPSSLP